MVRVRVSRARDQRARWILRKLLRRSRTKANGGCTSEDSRARCEKASRQRSEDIYETFPGFGRWARRRRTRRWRRRRGGEQLARSRQRLHHDDRNDDGRPRRRRIAPSPALAGSPGPAGFAGPLLSFLDAATKTALQQTFAALQTAQKTATDAGKSPDDVRDAAIAAAKARLDQAVSDDALTKGQAAAVLAALTKQASARAAVIDAAAGVLKLTPTDLAKRLAAGDRLDAIAQAQGVDLKDVFAAIQKAQQAQGAGGFGFGFGAFGFGFGGGKNGILGPIAHWPPRVRRSGPSEGQGRRCATSPHSDAAVDADGTEPVKRARSSTLELRTFTGRAASLPLAVRPVCRTSP